MSLQHFSDPDLGLITIKPHRAAKHFIFRGTQEGIQITCPLHVTQSQVLEAFAKQKSKLPRLLQQKHTVPHLKKDTILEMTDFKVYITESGYGNQYLARFANNILELICPAGANYRNSEVQAFLVKNITAVLRYKAQYYLPQRLAELSGQVKKQFKDCKVSYGKQRLGRCDSAGSILLSYRLMLLPRHLSDYVMLHELAHLTEMNHGERFHDLLDRYCMGRHREWERELKAFRYPF